MTKNALINALGHMKVEIGSLVCLGCGHEHNCDIRGCALIRAAADELKRTQWIPAEERKPDPDEFVLGVCTAKLSEDAFLDDDVALVEYDDTADRWLLEAWPEAEDVKVSHWMPLPGLPEEITP